MQDKIFPDNNDLLSIDIDLFSYLHPSPRYVNFILTGQRSVRMILFKNDRCSEISNLSVFVICVDTCNCLSAHPQYMIPMTTLDKKFLETFCEYYSIRTDQYRPNCDCVANAIRLVCLQQRYYSRKIFSSRFIQEYENDIWKTLWYINESCTVTLTGPCN